VVCSSFQLGLGVQALNDEARSGRPVRAGWRLLGSPQCRPQQERPEAPCQYSFFGSCMLRTRLKWRLTAAAFLRLRSDVGFS
jgi:hypothetical protein